MQFWRNLLFVTSCFLLLSACGNGEGGENGDVGSGGTAGSSPTWFAKIGEERALNATVLYTEAHQVEG